MYEKVMELLRLLLAQTRAGKVDWEYMADDEMVRTAVGKGLVRIGREDNLVLTPTGGAPLPPATVYYVWIIGSNGRVTDRYIVTPAETHNYAITSQLYHEAQNKAQDSNQVLQSMIDSLSDR